MLSHGNSYIHKGAQSILNHQSFKVFNVTSNIPTRKHKIEHKQIVFSNLFLLSHGKVIYIKSTSFRLPFCDLSGENPWIRLKQFEERDLEGVRRAAGGFPPKKQLENGTWVSTDYM